MNTNQSDPDELLSVDDICNTLSDAANMRWIMLAHTKGGASVAERGQSVVEAMDLAMWASGAASFIDTSPAGGLVQMTEAMMSAVVQQLEAMDYHCMAYHGY